MSEASKGVLLIVEDEPLKRVTMKMELTEAGYRVLEAPDAPSALKLLASEPIHVAVTDLRLPGMDGLKLLEQIKAQSPQTHVILMTAYGSVDTAVEAIKRGAYDYLTKPFPTEQLLEKLDRLRVCQALSSGASCTRTEQLGHMVGRSYATRRLFEQMRKLALTDHPVLIQGETGTGTELVAETIHQLGPRAARPLLKYNCFATSTAQLDVELFDHQQGGFRRAVGGSIFLDEIDSIPMDLQVRLLRVLDGKTLQRPEEPGATLPDVRLLCATKKDLRRFVEQGKFREDLYYHLNAVCLFVPPLRDRREDIAVLAEKFLKRPAAHTGSRNAPTRLSPHVIDVLMAYHWPGNVRELEQVVARAAAFAEGEELRAKDLALPGTTGSSLPEPAVIPEGLAGLAETIAGVERTLIDNALRKAAGNQAKAAQILGIPRTTLRDKMTKYGMVGEPLHRPVAS